MACDPLTNGFIALKEIAPEGIFQTTINFPAGTASNGSTSTVNSTNLFNPALAGPTDFADVYSLSNLASLNGNADRQGLRGLARIKPFREVSPDLRPVFSAGLLRGLVGELPQHPVVGRCQPRMFRSVHQPKGLQCRLVLHWFFH